MSPTVPGGEAGRQCWLDIRTVDGELRDALCQEALHHGFDAIVGAEAADLEPLPPTVTRILIPDGRLPDDFGRADLVLIDPTVHGEPATHARDGVRFGTYVTVRDSATLDVACASVRRDSPVVLAFHDPTNIPMEIVLAAAADTPGLVVTTVTRAEDAAVQLSVLEHGPGGLLLTTRTPGEPGRLREVMREGGTALALSVLTVTATRFAGRGARACVDTCAYLAKDEGMLIGSRARGLVLCVSETHPLPYMPTRPFRVNAGAIMSYTLATPERTRYLSELGAGDILLAVGADGRTRPVTVGRIKVETRPLLSIEAVSEQGDAVNVIVQNDWHVRILGPGGAVLNCTELACGDQILGYLPGRERHVGYPIDEMCIEL